MKTSTKHVIMCLLSGTMWLRIIYLGTLVIMVVLCRSEHDTGLPCPGPPDKGPCNRHIFKWAYDAEKKTCVMFIWGGCAGNDKNRFDSEIQCLRRCAPLECNHKKKI